MTSHLKSHLDLAKSEIAQALAMSAREYFELGMDLYARKKRYPFSRFQAILGTLAISIELLLKCIVARKIFPKLYEGLSAESQAILTFPEAMPGGTLPSSFLNDLKTFSQKAIDLNQAISYFYLLHPEEKQELHPHLKVLPLIRNVALHGAVPAFQAYQLERVAYLACKLFLLAQKQGILTLGSSALSKQAEEVVSKFNAERIDRVHRSIESARTKTKSLDYLRSYSSDPGVWEFRVETCPVCDNDGTAYGYPQEDQDGDEPVLTFWKDQFECDCCGLLLNDFEELQLAGIEVAEEITSRISDWHADNARAGS